MCIIAIKRAGQAALPADIVKQCWQGNPDGAGFVIHRPGEKGKLLIQKGFMTLVAFTGALDAAGIQQTDTVIYHFRIATSGGISAANCHPFPISSNPQDVKALEIYCDRAFIHNGIIGKGSRQFSDTQLYVMNTLSKLKSIKRNLKKIGNDTHGSRTVTLESNGAMHMTGNWIEDNGYLFSNSGFQRKSYPGLAAWGSSQLFDAPDFCDLCGGEPLIPLDGALICGECGTTYVQCDDCGSWEEDGAVTEYTDDNGSLWTLCWDCCARPSAYDSGDDWYQGKKYAAGSDSDWLFAN